MAMKVVIASSEVTPFAKTGGLADVTGTLSHVLKNMGCQVMVFLPYYREVWQKGISTEKLDVDVTVPIDRRILTVGIYRSVTPGGVSVYLLKRDEYYDRTCLYATPEGDYFDNLERFTLFSRAVVEALMALKAIPDIIHCNDWQTGLIPAYIQSLYAPHFKKTATVFTIHNIAYQGLFPATLFDITGLPAEMYNMEGIEFWGKINLLKAGIVYSDVVTTVSETYSKEIQTPEYGYGLEGVLRKRKDRLFGVLNGVDYSQWNPQTDRYIKANYSEKDLSGKAICKKDLLKEYHLDVNPSIPLIGIISRFAEQKGFDILSSSMEELMKLELAMVVLGTGERRYQTLFEELARRYPDKLSVKIAFDEALAHKLEAGCDFLLMPSRYEPCGLNQIYSLRYGTIPIVRATGGLDDTIRDYSEKNGNGFKFREYSPQALVEKVKEAISVYKNKKKWRTLQKRAMREDFSWHQSARKYLSIYRLAVGLKRGELSSAELHKN